MSSEADSDDDLPTGKLLLVVLPAFYKASSAGYAFNHNYWPPFQALFRDLCVLKSSAGWLSEKVKLQGKRVDGSVVTLHFLPFPFLYFSCGIYQPPPRCEINFKSRCKRTDNQRLTLPNSALLMLLSTNQYTFKPPPPFSPSLFATGPHIDSMHGPAELSQNKLHRLEFDNPFMRSASLISGWWLCLTPLQRRGEVAHWRRRSVAYSNCFIAFFVFWSLCGAVSES